MTCRLLIIVSTLVATASSCSGAYLDSATGELLPNSGQAVNLWWTSSGWKVGVDAPVPKQRGRAVTIRCARNEAEAAQLIVHPTKPLKKMSLMAGDLAGPDNTTIGAECVDILEVRYVNVTTPTDRTSVTGLWPDPLPPLQSPMDLQANRNQAFWIRVRAPRNARAGIYEGNIKLNAESYETKVPLKVEVYDFTLPDRMTCTTAFGFSPGNVFRYQKLKTDAQKHEVLDKYFANFSAHHISPYDPAPLDRIKVTWPNVKPPESKWQGGVVVSNEKHDGRGSLLVYDDSFNLNVAAMYKDRIAIPKSGLRLRFWYRTAVPDHQFLVTLTHYDASGEWMSGRNNDMGFEGNGLWQEYDKVITDFPEGAESILLYLRATTWTDAGENVGLVWFDDVSLSDAGSGRQLLEGGAFEPADLPEIEKDKLAVKFDFSAWDRAMERAIDHFKFNSYRQSIPGLGGGTFHARHKPSLLGFSEDTYIYEAIFNSYCGQLQEHLRRKGWLDEAFVYWFDEPAPKDYEFVNNGFAKLKAAAPDIDRMLTEQVEPGLIGGPNIWCPVTHHYDHQAAESRRAHGEIFWWYVCTGPKAPYCTLFIDHPGTELRLWLWQTWKYKVKGILVWQTNYWTSSAAYPDSANPQNPYEDPMGWRSGYSTPKGEKRPWGNGDGRFIYPPLAAADANPPAPVLDGPVDSIRWEMLREGIEDYEYFAMLQRLLHQKHAELSPDDYRQTAALLRVPPAVTSDMTTFTTNPQPMEDHRDKVARAIARLVSR